MHAFVDQRLRLLAPTSAEGANAEGAKISSAEGESAADTASSDAAAAADVEGILSGGGGSDRHRPAGANYEVWGSTASSVGEALENFGLKGPLISHSAILNELGGGDFKGLGRAFRAPRARASRSSPCARLALAAHLTRALASSLPLPPSQTPR